MSNVVSIRRTGFVAHEVLAPIVAASARRFGVTRAKILSRCRTDLLVHARGHVIDELHARGYSAAAIGRALKRDHTTVFHWIRKGRG